MIATTLLVVFGSLTALEIAYRIRLRGAFDRASQMRKAVVLGIVDTSRGGR